MEWIVSKIEMQNSRRLKPAATFDYMTLFLGIFSFLFPDTNLTRSATNTLRPKVISKPDRRSPDGGRMHSRHLSSNDAT
jgi:hypothetical protein